MIHTDKILTSLTIGSIMITLISIGVYSYSLPTQTNENSILNDNLKIQNYTINQNGVNNNYGTNMTQIEQGDVVVGMGGTGYGDGIVGGGGSTGCCEGVGNLYDLDNGSQVLVTIRNGPVGGDNGINYLESKGVIIVDQFDSKGCKETSYTNVEWGIICNNVNGKASGIADSEEKWGWEHRNDMP